MSFEDSRKRIEEHKKIIENLVDKIKQINPNAQFDKRQYATDLIYYTVSVVKGKVKTNKETRSLYIKDDAVKLLKGKFLSEDDAKKSIGVVLPFALEKFDACKEAYFSLCKQNQFNVGFNYDGDSHGIYNEYDYISFTLDGFSFQFAIGD